MNPRERLFALEHFGIKLGLDNINTLLNALGRPELAFASVHVGGTNGKGSVTAMVERGLRAAGHRTGRYTSPHLVTIEERIVVGGEPVSPEDFDEVTDEVLSVVDKLQNSGALSHSPTFFEVTTAIAFEVFRRANVTAAVIEVGLGGRFDATNVITPELSAITSIALDHERHLGNTLGDIAFEKAGIIKEETPVIVGPLAPEAYEVITNVAHSRNAPLIEAKAGAHGTPVRLALNGAHQQGNAAIAVEILRRSPLPSGVATAASSKGRDGYSHLAREHIVTALTDVEWPARLEWMRTMDFGDVLLDAAHNPAGARALTQYVMETTGPLPMMVAIMRDKDVDSIIRELAPAVSRFVATTADSPRSLTASELASRINQILPAVPCLAQHSATAALAEITVRGGRSMIAGSIFLVGPMRGHLVAHGARTVRYPSEANLFYLD